MQITLKFRDADARRVTYYLRRRYQARSTAKLALLAMAAIRREVAAEAQKELDESDQPDRTDQ